MPSVELSRRADLDADPITAITFKVGGAHSEQPMAARSCLCVQHPWIDSRVPRKLNVAKFVEAHVGTARSCNERRIGGVNHFDLTVGREAQQCVRPGRRFTLWLASNAVVASLVLAMPPTLLAEEGATDEKNDQSVLGGLLSLFDPNETNKLGKKLPKSYLKSAREVVRTLRESFVEDTSNDAKFRRTADSARGAIRDYIVNWRGSTVIDGEQSYQALERALRVLGEFYSKMGPRAVLPEEVRNRVLNDLQMADDAL